MKILKYLLISLRPKQWVKNLFVFAALIFAGQVFVFENFLKTAVAFLILCALASSVYLINDWKDLESDRTHPIKKLRPLAAGKLNLKIALFAAALLIIAGLATSFYLNFNFGAISFFYLALNFVYSFFVKKIAVLDIISVSIGFVLRAIAGAEVIAVEISPWLIVCTFFIALFLVLGKRRADAVNHQKTEVYAPEFLDQLLVMTASITILAYVLYTIDAKTIAKFGSSALLYSTPFVVYGIFRYFYLVSRHQKGGSPTETLLTDLPILLSLGFWGIMVGVIIYL